MQNASDFKLMDRRAAESILSMPERNMFFRATSSWVGFKTISVSFEVREREAGVSKWSAWSLVKYAFTNIVAFTTVPLQFVTVGGGICFLFSACTGCILSCPVFYRTCSGGLYDNCDRSSSDRKRYYAQSGNHRVLYRKNL